MRKIAKKQYVGIICAFLVAIIACVFTLKFFPQSAKAENVSEEKISNLTEGEYSFTDNHIVNGIDVVNEYAQQRFGTSVEITAVTNQIFLAVNGSDDIIKVLPERLFKTPGRTFHIGKEWGFFIDCTYPYDGIDILVSTVVIFDLDTNGGSLVTNSDYPSFLKFTFKRVFQGDFAYLASNDVTQMFSIPKRSDDNLYANSYQYDVNLEYNDNATYHIVPIPMHFGGTDIRKAVQHNKYFFTDMAAGLSMKNVNAKNAGDIGYDINTDNGSFISQMDYTYQALYIKPSDKAAAEQAIGNFLGSRCKDVVSKVNPFGVVIKVADLYNEIYDTVENVRENMKSHAISIERKVSSKSFYNSQGDQIEQYGFFTRNVFMTITSPSDLQLLIKDGEFSFLYQVNSPSNLVYSRYEAFFTFGLCKITMTASHDVVVEETVDFTSSISGNIYHNSNYKEIPEVNAVNGAANFESHILPNYYNLIKFTPDVTGYYDITGNYKDGNTSNLGISVYEIGSGVTHLNMGNPIKTSAGGKVTSVWLESGKSYFVKSDLMAGNLAEGFYYGDFSLNFKRDAKLVDIGATTVNFDNSGYSYVKIQADGNYYYAFNASGVNIVTLDENMNVLDEVGADGVKLDNGALQYFRIERASGNADSVALTIEKRRKIVYNYDNGQGEETVWVINDNYPTMPTPRAKEGYEYLGWSEEDRFNYHYNETNIRFLDKADIVLIADWAKTYKVHYNTMGGEALPDGVFNERWTAVLRDTAVRDGYLFVGWYDNSNCTGDYIISFPPGTNTDQTVYAKWEPMVFTMTFYNNGSLVATKQVSNGRSFVTPNITKKYHYGTWRSLLSTVYIGGSLTCRGADERFDAQWYVTSPYTVSTYIRNNQYTITDSGVFNQSYDNVFPFTSEETSIYGTARIVIQFTAWEKDDGYQHVMLYDGSGSGATLLGERQFEHGGSKKDTNPADYEFVFEINLSNMTNKNLCVRYSASGFGADTWYNTTMTCSITFYE